MEAEDIDFGGARPDDLAFDVDEDMDEQDADALDSDDEQELNEEFGLDPDEIDRMVYQSCFSHHLLIALYQCPCTLFHYIPCYRATSKCVSFSRHLPVLGL
jgi:hypothetical protein